MASVKGDVKVEYWHSERKGSRFKENATLDIVRDEKNSKTYWLCIGPKHSRKTTYRIRKNVQKMFNKELENGKATIELMVPRVLIYIRNADVAELRPFLRNIEEIVVDPDFELEFVARPRGPQALEGRRRVQDLRDEEEEAGMNEPNEYEHESGDDDSEVQQLAAADVQGANAGDLQIAADS